MADRTATIDYAADTQLQEFSRMVVKKKRCQCVFKYVDCKYLRNLMELPSDIQGFGDPRLLKFHNNVGLHVLGFVRYFLVNLIIRWGLSF